jgi:hypothetical protein
MARQDVVRALVPRERVDELLTLLTEELALDSEAVEVEVPEQGTYRDEQPDRELRHLVRTGRVRLAVGAAIGAVLGGVLALAVPAVREYAAIIVPLFLFGGAWAGGAVAAARSVQQHRDEGPRGERIHRVGAEDQAQLRLVTVRDVTDRPAVSDRLADAGVVLLDTQHPRVGHDRPGQRPAAPGDDDQGPPAP